MECSLNITCFKINYNNYLFSFNINNMIKVIKCSHLRIKSFFRKKNRYPVWISAKNHIEFSNT
jgi:hypothetical protein